MGSAAVTREQSIPGVRCGKCLGRIDAASIDTKRRIHDKVRPGEPFVPPRLCSECRMAALVALAEDDV
jgi:hypothetical protein